MADRPLLAVLIDADNTSPKHAHAIFDEIASFGEASVRRCYGDFSSQQMAGWNRVQAEHGLVPLHSPANTVGKNSSDISLVIDAMDLLHTGRFSGFVLVSSDSDFTRLASRIREQGLDVYGIGQKKTPDAFRKACKRFIFLENLGGATTEKSAPKEAAASNDDKLRMYALYRQASDGDVQGKRPGMLHVIERAKYDAWAAMKGTPREAAMQRYIDEVEAIRAKYG